MGINTYGKGFVKTMNIKEENKEAMLPPIIAVDFDGTLVKNAFPTIGEINWFVWEAVEKAQAEGNKIILWTSRTGQLLDEAVEFCERHNLKFDAVNDNIPEVKALGWDARKVFATMYIDDRMGTVNFDGGFSPVMHALF